MRLSHPFEIGSRLLPALRVGDGVLSLEHVGYHTNGKAAYRWYLDLPGESYSAADLAGHEPLQGMFGSLLAFLSAAGEGWYWEQRDGYGECADLFPPAVAEWAYQHSDELDALRLEIEESGAALIED